MEVSVTGGVPVLLRVGGFDDDAGNGTLTLTLVACPADIDMTGTVDFADLLEVITGWGPCP